MIALVKTCHLVVFVGVWIQRHFGWQQCTVKS